MLRERTAAVSARTAAVNARAEAAIGLIQALENFRLNTGLQPPQVYIELFERTQE